MSPAPSSSQSRIQALRSLVNGESQSGTGHVDFAEPEEHRALRAAVAGIAAKFGPRYYAERAGARRPCAELWQALGDAGFIGVNIPEEYGGGGGGLTELALVCEEIAAAGTPLLLLLVSAAISAEMIADFGTDEQRRTWLPGLASGAVKVVFAITEPDVGSNTLRISTTASRDGDDWVPKARSTTSPGSTRRRPCWWSRGPGRTSAAASCPCSSCRAMPGACRNTCSRWTCCCPSGSSPCTSTAFGSARGALVGEEGKGFPAGFPRPESRNGSPEPPLGVGIARYALGPRRGMPPERRSGPSRSAPTRAYPTRWPRPRSRPNSPALMIRQAAGQRRPTASPAEGSPPAWPSTPPPRPRSPPSTRPSRRTAGTAWPSEYGLIALPGPGAAAAHRAGQPGDDPQLRRPAQPGPAPLRTKSQRQPHEPRP